ncbi:unnamed protein product, partial [Choristocarpus tenellus]
HNGLLQEKPSSRRSCPLHAPSPWNGRDGRRLSMRQAGMKAQKRGTPAARSQDQSSSLQGVMVGYGGDTYTPLQSHCKAEGSCKVSSPPLDQNLKLWTCQLEARGAEKVPLPLPLPLQAKG